jgi:hypothetical protein
MALMYDGTGPDARIAGLMYYSTSAVEPEGFAGRNDAWHYHERVCVRYTASGVDAPFGMDNESTDAQCASVGGTVTARTHWMVHVWAVPGFDGVEGGVFAQVNPALACPDGTYHERPPEEWASNPLNSCRSAASVAVER